MREGAVGGVLDEARGSGRGVPPANITDLEPLYVMDDLTDLWLVNTPWSAVPKRSQSRRAGPAAGRPRSRDRAEDIFLGGRAWDPRDGGSTGDFPTE